MSDFFGQEIQVLQITVPVGTMVDWPGDTAPNDWMLAHGQALKRSDYPTLFGVLGVKFGAGSGDGTEFNLPDTRDRVVVGVSTAKPAGQTGGAESHVLTTAQMPSHGHGVSDPTHAHGVYDPGHIHGYLHSYSENWQAPPGGGGQAFNKSQEFIGTDSRGTGIGIYGAATGISIQANGGGGAHSIMQPFIAISQIIKII